jgi:hypothetical protein
VVVTQKAASLSATSATSAVFLSRRPNEKNGPPAWLFFDNREQRAAYNEWLMAEASAAAGEVDEVNPASLDAPLIPHHPNG